MSVFDRHMGTLLARKVRKMSTTPILFIHGGSHGPWFWGPVREFLSKEGIETEAPALPGRDGTRTDVEVLYEGAASCLRALDRPSVIAAHSMGGAVAVLIADRLPHLVKGVAFVSAIVPKTGVNPLTDTWGRMGGVIMRSTERIMSLQRARTAPPAIFSRYAFGHRLSAQQSEWLLSNLNAERSRLTRDAFPVYDLSATRCIYIMATKDRLLPIKSQLRFALRAGGLVHVMESGHSLPVEHPQSLARLLETFMAELSC
jgi:pimeloyl-ACP methyl ester carboxylesterase